MKRLPENGLSFLAEAINENFTVSFITYIEFLGYKDATKANKDFIDLATIIEINRDIIDTCIDLRKTYRIKLPDAIIASTALVYNLTIITNNEKDFKNIDVLEFINPYKV
jgi:predicted nucleic acid-binding protein